MFACGLHSSNFYEIYADFASVKILDFEWREIILASKSMSVLLSGEYIDWVGDRVW